MKSSRINPHPSFNVKEKNDLQEKIIRTHNRMKVLRKQYLEHDIKILNYRQELEFGKAII